jgi:hypothetical protein
MMPIFSLIAIPRRGVFKEMKLNINDAEIFIDCHSPAGSI